MVRPHHVTDNQAAPSEGADHRPSGKASTDDTLMAEVVKVRAEGGTSGGPGRACQLAVQQYLDTSPDIFKVKSGEFKGMKVPESVRCAVFQSNIAEAAGLISPRDVTVRALEFGELMHSKGYREQTFKPGQSYPDGTYIVGNGAHDGTNSRHVGMVCGGRLIHTFEGKVVNWPISQKFSAGSYDSIKVYIPPAGSRRAELDPEITNAAVS
jgi:hypothetical protein